MTENKLTNIQWQCMRQSTWACVGSVLVGELLYFSLWYTAAESTWLQDIVFVNWNWTIPPYPGTPILVTMLVIGLFTAFFVGLCVGYIYGNLTKKRIEILLQSAMMLERGVLSTRIPDLGEDEIGRLGKQLNDMTIRFEQQVASLQRLSAHNAQLNDQVKQAAIIEERQRLARELHDAVSQQLFAISMTMAALKRTLLQNPEKASLQVSLVEEMASAAQSEMRALLLHLRPAHLEGKALKQGVEDLLHELATKHPLKFEWHIDHISGLPRGMEDHLFRILQESLSNILRHAKATFVEVRLTVIQNNLRLKIVDDGVGFSPEDDKKSSSYGLSLMQERVAEIGGVLNVLSAPGQGTLIEVTVPLITNRSEGLQ